MLRCLFFVSGLHWLVSTFAVYWQRWQRPTFEYNTSYYGLMMYDDHVSTDFFCSGMEWSIGLLDSRRGDKPSCAGRVEEGWDNKRLQLWLVCRGYGLRAAGKEGGPSVQFDLVFTMAPDLACMAIWIELGFGLVLTGDSAPASWILGGYNLGTICAVNHIIRAG